MPFVCDFEECVEDLVTIMRGHEYYQDVLLKEGAFEKCPVECRRIESLMKMVDHVLERDLRYADKLLNICWPIHNICGLVDEALSVIAKELGIIVFLPPLTLETVCFARDRLTNAIRD